MKKYAKKWGSLLLVCLVLLVSCFSPAPTMEPHAFLYLPQNPTQEEMAKALQSDINRYSKELGFKTDLTYSSNEESDHSTEFYVSFKSSSGDTTLDMMVEKSIATCYLAINSNSAKETIHYIALLLMIMDESYTPEAALTEAEITYNDTTSSSYENFHSDNVIWMTRFVPSTDPEIPGLFTFMGLTRLVDVSEQNEAFSMDG